MSAPSLFAMRRILARRGPGVRRFERRGSGQTGPTRSGEVMADATTAARVHGRRLANSDGVEWMARAGLAARGITYAIVGLLAVKLALGDGGKTTGQQGALKEIAQQPFGKVMLVALAIGLAGYGVWKLVCAAMQTSDGFHQRIGAIVGGIIYLGLCGTAIKILAGAGGGSGNAQDKATAGVLGWPAGPWIIGIV